MRIDNAEFIRSFISYEECPEPLLPEFAFIGRSNVGKSSLINMLTQRKELAITSSKPGRTAAINFFEINQKWNLVDLPGYGYARRSKTDRAKFNEFVSDYLAQRESLKCTFALIDSRIPPQKIDLEFTQWLMEHEIPFVLVFTKIDKLKPSKVKANIQAFTDAMSEFCAGLPRIYQASSTKREGRKELLEFIEAILQQS